MRVIISDRVSRTAEASGPVPYRIALPSARQRSPPSASAFKFERHFAAPLSSSGEERQFQHSRLELPQCVSISALPELAPSVLIHSFLHQPDRSITQADHATARMLTAER
jgi:hypothetical protein